MVIYVYRSGEGLWNSPLWGWTGRAGWTTRVDWSYTNYVIWAVQMSEFSLLGLL